MIREKHENNEEEGRMALEGTKEGFFKEALSNFTSEVAYAGAVRHLYDLGYSVEEIRENLHYPASCEQIRRVIEAYEEKKQNPEKQYDFVQDVDAYGKKSYRRVKKEEKQ